VSDAREVIVALGWALGIGIAVWMVVSAQWDFAWLRRCDAILRLPGHSPGADREMAAAAEQGIPAFGSVDAVIEWARRSA